MRRLTEAPVPIVVRVPMWKAGAFVDIFANAALRWLCRGAARGPARLVRA